MTISSEDIRTNATATAGQTSFTFTFLVFDSDDVAVYIDKVKQSSGFTVTLDTPSDLPSAGTVDFSPDPSFDGGESVVMVAEASYEQDTDIQNAGTLAEEKVETGLDKIVRLIHQLLDALKRSPKFGAGSTSTDITFPEPSSDAYVGWNSGGTDLENKSDVTIQGDVVLSDNEVAAKVGTADPDGLPVGINEVVGRAGGDLETIAVPSNSVLARAGTTLTSIAVSASQVLGRTASGALKALSMSELRSISGISRWELIEEKDVSGVADVVFSSFDTTKYARHKIVLEDVGNDSASGELRMLGSDDGGATFQTATAYANRYDSIGTTTTLNVNNVGYIIVHIASSSDTGLYGEIVVPFLGDAGASVQRGYPRLYGDITSNLTRVISSGRWNQNIVFDAWKLYPEGGGTISGKFQLWGWIE